MDRARIAYDVGESSLGPLLVAATERGVCHVRFGGDGAALAAELRAEFPFAVIARDPARVGRFLAAFVRFAEGRSRELRVPLDVRGSRFQRRVWDAIRRIPYGATRSYGELAATLGRPGAARAVAGACAANPVALAIPCHRVVARDDLGGYAWGAARKRALLEAEAPAETAARRGARESRAAATATPSGRC